jgi:hypothetical protein
MSTVPRHVSRRLAAALTLLSRDAIDVLVEQGALHDEGTGHWSKIPVSEIESIIHRPVTAESYLAARVTISEARDRQPWRQRQSHVAA